MKKNRVHAESQQNQPSNEPDQSRIRQYFYDFHRRYWRMITTDTQSYDLLVCRIFSIIIWFYIVIIEFLAYSKIMKPSMIILNFLFGSAYSLKDISAIIYASGAATYGTSIEFYLIFPFLIINGILALINCGIDHSQTRSSIAYIANAIALFMGNELAYQNFKRFTFQQSYQLHCRTASRVMLRQSIYLTVTIIFLVSPGLRFVYNRVRFRCPYSNTTITESCYNIIDIERPIFENHFTCVADYTAMITGMEQLRIIRDIALCSIAFYSVYNKGFLDITGMTSVKHKMMLLLFFAMGCSVIAVNIDPLYFSNIKLYFTLIEIVIFVILMIILIVNLQEKYEHRKFIIMQQNPTIFG